MGEFLGAEPGGFWREAELHQQFAHLRIAKHGEHFQPNPELLSYIEEL